MPLCDRCNRVMPKHYVVHLKQMVCDGCLVVITEEHRHDQAMFQFEEEFAGMTFTVEGDTHEVRADSRSVVGTEAQVVGQVQPQAQAVATAPGS